MKDTLAEKLLAEHLVDGKLTGGVEVAMALAGQPYYIVTPKIWGVYVEGAFQPYVSGKDLILELLRRFSCNAGTGKIMDFYGPGVKNMWILSNKVG